MRGRFRLAGGEAIYFVAQGCLSRGIGQVSFDVHADFEGALGAAWEMLAAAPATRVFAVFLGAEFVGVVFFARDFEVVVQDVTPHHF